jgi:hypothetical protein
MELSDLLDLVRRGHLAHGDLKQKIYPPLAPDAPPSGGTGRSPAAPPRGKPKSPSTLKVVPRGTPPAVPPPVFPLDVAVAKGKRSARGGECFYI